MAKESNEPPLDDSLERNEWAGEERDELNEKMEVTQLYRVGASKQLDPMSAETQDDTNVERERRPSHHNVSQPVVHSPPRPKPPGRLRALISAIKTDKGDQSTTDSDAYKAEQFGSVYEPTQWCNTAFDEDSDTTTTHVAKAKEKKKRKTRGKGNEKASRRGKRRRSLLNMVDKALRRSKDKHAGAQSQSAVDNSQCDVEPAESQWQWQCKWPVCCAVLRCLHALLCAAAASLLLAMTMAAYGTLVAAGNAAVVCITDAIVLSTHICARCRRRVDVAASMRRMSMPLDAMAAVLLVTTLMLCVNMMFVDADNAPKPHSHPVQFYLAITALAACAVSAPISIVHFFCG